MSAKTEFIIRFWSLLSAACTLLFGVVLYITFDSTAPFKSTDSVTTITKQNGANVLVESRGFTGTDTQEITIYRTFYHQGGAITHRVAVEGGVVINQKTDYVVLRSFVLPTHIDGAWCSSAVAYWRPLFSLKQHSVKLQDLCFEVPNHD
jgi:hypothetical protein